jgi:hypothetical protein
VFPPHASAPRYLVQAASPPRTSPSARSSPALPRQPRAATLRLMLGDAATSRLLRQRDVAPQPAPAWVLVLALSGAWLCSEGFQPRRHLRRAAVTALYAALLQWQRVLL